MSTLTKEAPVRWSCLCGTGVAVPLDRVVPDHNDRDGYWCAVSRCTLAPRVLAAAGVPVVDCLGTQYMSHALSVGMFDACDACGTDNR